MDWRGPQVHEAWRKGDLPYRRCRSIRAPRTAGNRRWEPWALNGTKKAGGFNEAPDRPESPAKLKVVQRPCGLSGSRCRGGAIIQQAFTTKISLEQSMVFRAISIACATPLSYPQHEHKNWARTFFHRVEKGVRRGQHQSGASLGSRAAT